MGALNKMQNTLVLYIVSSIFTFKFNLPYFYIFLVCISNFLFSPLLPSNVLMILQNQRNVCFPSKG